MEELRLKEQRPTEIWGPPLWKIIHGIGYHTGKGSKELIIDEKREFQWLIKHLEMIIPCPDCRRHLIDYRAAHSLDSNLRLWEFHQAVNARLKKNGVEFSDNIGKDAKLSDGWAIYLKSLETYILTGKLVRKDVNEFGRHFNMWLRFAL